MGDRPASDRASSARQLAERRAAATQVFVEDLEAPVLDEADHHHLSRVLRLRVGEVVVAADGDGSWVACRYQAHDGLEPIADIRFEPASPYVLGVGFAPVKGDRPELVVQKLTELGIDRIVAPFSSPRSVVRWDGERGDRHLERLRSVAISAARQSRRVRLPEVALGELSALRDEGAVLADSDGRAPVSTDRMVLVGPEGGWSDDELVESEVVSLGTAILRSETAALAAGVLLTALRVGLVGQHLPSSR